METPRMRPMPQRFPSSQAMMTPYPQYLPIHPSFFPPGWYGPQWGQLPMSQSQYGALPALENWSGEEKQAVAGPSTECRALITLPKPIRRDTPTSYPTPPCDDPDNPPAAIHPYLYDDGCPVVWDVRENLIHKARRIGGERLSNIALKANAINAGGVNHKTMRIVCCDETFPWSVVIKRDIGITVCDVLTEIAHTLDKELTESERFIAAHQRLADMDKARLENEGTGAVKTREKGDVMRRVDWLGKKTRFRGLQHSSARRFEALIKRRIHVHDRPTTWVMVLEDRE